MRPFDDMHHCERASAQANTMTCDGWGLPCCIVLVPESRSACNNELRYQCYNMCGTFSTNKLRDDILTCLYTASYNTNRKKNSVLSMRCLGMFHSADSCVLNRGKHNTVYCHDPPWGCLKAYFSQAITAYSWVYTNLSLE